MKKFILVVGLLALIGMVKAQDSAKGTSYFLSYYGTGGVHFFSDISPLNNALKANGLPELLSHIPAYHAGVSIGCKRLLFQFTERMYDLPVKEKGNYELSATGEGYELKFGYNLLKNNNVSLYPYIGLGAHEFSWTIDDLNPKTLSDALNSFSRQTNQLTVENEQLASVGILLNVRLFSFSKERFDFMLGADVHYLHSASGRWRLNDQIIDAGDVDLGGLSTLVTFSLNLNLGKL